MPPRKRHESNAMLYTLIAFVGLFIAGATVAIIYYVKAEDFKTKEAASRLAETLTRNGWSSFTKTSGDYEVVLAGSFAGKKEAESRIGRLQKKFTDCFIKQI